MLLFLFLVAVLNLGLGFALAVYIAQHKPESTSAAPPFVPFSSLAGTSLEPATSPVVADGGPAMPSEDAVHDTTSSEPAPTADPQADHAATPAVEEGPAAPVEEPTTTGDLRGSQASVGAVQAQVKQYNDQLSQFSDDFRNVAPSADPAWFQERMQSLRTANESYLESRNGAYEAFESTHRAVKEHEAICDTLDEAMVLQTTKIQESNDSIESYNFQGDVKDGCKRMTVETSKLTDVNHQVRDALEVALSGVARQEQWLDSSPPSMRTDPLTGIANRAGLEAKLTDWWSKDPHRSRQLCIALVDFDHFGKLNERHGQIVGDELLRAMAQLLGAEAQNASMVARYSGQRFAVIFTDTDIRMVTNFAERFRQLVEISLFHRGDQDIQITLSCGVTEGVPKDTCESLIERAEATLREAKRYGRNRTFVHDGKFPTPVVPPNFPLQERHMSL